VTFLFEVGCPFEVVWLTAASIVDVANELGLKDRKFSKGFPELNRELPFSVDSSRSKDILGLVYRSKEDTTRSLVEDFAKRGFSIGVQAS
jgi:hypothetical protein